MLNHQNIITNDNLAVIFRIIGNENPPRDTIGKRLSVLEHILKNEPKFDNVEKWYLLNRLHNIQFRRSVCELLDKYNAKYVTIPLDRKFVISADSRNEQIIRAININGTRNFAIEFAKTLATYVVILDGDCLFSADGWKSVANEMKSQRYDYLSIPHKRTNGGLAEPMIAFKSTSTKRFDERIPFGEGDKLNLLFDLGHNREPGSGHCNITGEQTKLVGYVIHLDTGPEEYETNTKSRIEARTKSIDNLLYSIKNNEPIRTFSNNNFYEKIDGFFDYSGQYSGFALDCCDNAHIVEVGSWLGKSAIYLASEFAGYGKRVRIDCVDTWDGGNDEFLRNKCESLSVYDTFIQNVDDAGFHNIIKAVRQKSVEAAANYDDNSLDLVWIDAGHSYDEVKEDIKAWYPKVRYGGLIAGHDFAMNHEISRKGVIKAVLEFFKDKPLEVQPMGRTWKSVKYDTNWPEFRSRSWA